MADPLIPPVMGLSYTTEEKFARVHNPNPLGIELQWSGFIEIVPPGETSKRLYTEYVAENLAIQFENSFTGCWCVNMPSTRERKARMDDHRQWPRLREGWQIVTGEQYDFDPQLADMISAEPIELLTVEPVALAVTEGAAANTGSLLQQIKQLKAQNAKHEQDLSAALEVINQGVASGAMVVLDGKIVPVERGDAAVGDDPPATDHAAKKAQLEAAK